MSKTKLLMESWRNFLSEGWAEDVEGVIKDRDESFEASKARLKQFMKRKRRAKDTPPVGEEDWAAIEKEKEAEKETEKESSWEEREKTRSILHDNIEIILSSRDGADLFYHFIDRYATLYRLEPEETRELITKNIAFMVEKDKKNPLNTTKIKKILGKGAYGIVYELNNDHVLKLFKDGMYGMKKDLEWYKEMYDRQFTKQSEPGELAVYGYGIIQSPPFGTEPKDPIEVGYAEIGKVIPFPMWIAQNNPGFEKDKITNSWGLFNHLRDFLSDMAYDFDWNSNEDDKGNPKIEPISAYPDENSYVKHVLKALLRFKPNNMPQEGEDGWGMEDLKNILKAVYRLAVQDGQEYLFGGETSDIHANNFGYSLQTNRVVVYDK